MVKNLAYSSAHPSIVKQSRCRPLLGTFVEISLFGESTANFEADFSKAFSAIKDVEQRMNFHHSDSELSRVNAIAHQTEVQIHESLASVIRFCQTLNQLTEGAFDVAIPGNPGKILDVEFQSKNSIYFRQPLQIDLGGVAKGFAVDQAITVLKHSSVLGGWVNAGGDIRRFGPYREPIWLRYPTGWHEVRPDDQPREAVATSKPDFHYDGRTRTRVLRPCSVSVWAHECMHADALTKVVSTLGDDASPVLAHFDAVAFRVDLSESRE